MSAKCEPPLRAPYLRAKGPAPYQPRATPWVNRPQRPSPEGATPPPRPNLARPYRAKYNGWPIPRALPWAGIGRTFGAERAGREIDQQVYALYGLTPEEIKIVEGASK